MLSLAPISDMHTVTHASSGSETQLQTQRGLHGEGLLAREAQLSPQRRLRSGAMGANFGELRP